MLDTNASKRREQVEVYIDELTGHYDIAHREKPESQSLPAAALIATVNPSIPDEGFADRTIPPGAVYLQTTQTNTVYEIGMPRFSRAMLGIGLGHISRIDEILSRSTPIAGTASFIALELPAEAKSKRFRGAKVQKHLVVLPFNSVIYSKADLDYGGIVELAKFRVQLRRIYNSAGYKVVDFIKGGAERLHIDMLIL